MRRSSAILFYHLGVLASADRLTLAPELHGELVSQRRSGATSFHHRVHPERSRRDALGSTRNLTNSAQTVTDTRDCQAFGLTNASSSSTANRGLAASPADRPSSTFRQLVVGVFGVRFLRDRWEEVRA